MRGIVRISPHVMNMLITHRNQTATTFSDFPPHPLGGAGADCGTPHSVWETGQTGETLRCAHQASWMSAGRPQSLTGRRGNHRSGRCRHLLLGDRPHQTQVDLQDAAQAHHHERAQEAVAWLHVLAMVLHSKPRLWTLNVSGPKGQWKCQRRLENLDFELNVAPTNCLENNE